MPDSSLGGPIDVIAALAARGGSDPALLWERGLLALAVTGPPTSEYFHINPSDEVLHQIAGGASVETIVPGRILATALPPGQTLTIPAGVPHRPVRAAASVGLVVERVRGATETEAFEWWCRNCVTPIGRLDLRASEVALCSERVKATERELASKPCPHCGGRVW